MKIKFYKYAFRHKKTYIISIFGLILSLFFAPLGPKLMGKITDRVILEGGIKLFWPLCIMMVISYTLTGVFHYIEEYNSDKISRLVASDVRKDLFEFLMREDGKFFSKRTAADLLSRISSDANNIGLSFGFCGVFLLEELGTIAVMVLSILFISPAGIIVPIVLLPVIAILAYIAETKGDRILDQISDKAADINQAASEAIIGIRTVKSFGREEKEKNRFRLHNKSFHSLSNMVDFVWADWYSPVEALSRIMVVLNLLFSGYLVIKGRISIGELTAIFQYTNMLIFPIIDMGWLLRILSQARSGERKINTLYSSEPEIVGADSSENVVLGDMEFRNVSLDLDGRVLLDDISFTLEKGKCVAIMGATGSGKSLIASMAARLIDPTSGGIYINGRDIREMPLSLVRSFSSVVSQDVFLFSDTVMDNIRLGKKGIISEERCIESAKKARADEYIRSLSDGYQTIIGERGVGLSGGQKQRLSIARALAKDSQALILDDATSALDMETERDIERTILDSHSRSLLIFAHRISAVSFADEIIFLEKGRIAERGTHSELIALHGLYYKTYISQYPEEA